MNPNFFLSEIRKLLTTPGATYGELERLMDLVGKLDGYLSDGGRLPDDWQVKR